jgi:hypothetical protein
MTYTFSLSQSDYLNHQLFLASQVQNLREQRRNSQIIWSVAFLLIAFNLYAEKKPFPAAVFAIIGVGWAIFYPSYAKKRQLKHFEKHVNLFLSEKFDQISTITIDGQLIHSEEENYEMKIGINQVKHIYETADYFYAHLKSGLTFIFPRKKIENLAALEDQLRDIAAKNQISFTELTNWKW